MKRRRFLSPSSLTSVTERERTGVVYAVFENIREDAEYRFFIYKLDSVEAAGKDDSPQELGHPIWRIKASDYPIQMKVFSVGSKLYFCGGWQRFGLREEYTSKAYVLDIAKLNSNSDSGDEGMAKLTSIDSMKSRIESPCVFGPIGHKVYIISDNLDEYCCSFQLFDASTNEWQNLPSPPVFESIRFDPSFHPEDVLSVRATALCSSNICLSTLAALFVFSTITNEWKTFGYDPEAVYDTFNFGPTNFPFVGGARSLFSQDETTNIFLVPPRQRGTLPMVYKSPPVVEMDDFEKDDVFKFSGEVKGLKNRWEELEVEMEVWIDQMPIKPEILGERVYVYVFPLDYESRVCFVWNGDAIVKESFVIDVCDVSLIEGANVEVENTATYKLSTNSTNGYLEVRHFVVA